MASICIHTSIFRWAQLFTSISAITRLSQTTSILLSYCLLIFPFSWSIAFISFLLRLFLISHTLRLSFKYFVASLLYWAALPSIAPRDQQLCDILQEVSFVHTFSLKISIDEKAALNYQYSIRALSLLSPTYQYNVLHFKVPIDRSHLPPHIACMCSRLAFIC